MPKECKICGYTRDTNSSYCNDCFDSMEHDEVEHNPINAQETDLSDFQR